MRLSVILSTGVGVEGVSWSHVLSGGLGISGRRFVSVGGVGMSQNKVENLDLGLDLDPVEEDPMEKP